MSRDYTLSVKLTVNMNRFLATLAVLCVAFAAAQASKCSYQFPRGFSESRGRNQRSEKDTKENFVLFF